MNKIVKALSIITLIVGCTHLNSPSKNNNSQVILPPNKGVVGYKGDIEYDAHWLTTNTLAISAKSNALSSGKQTQQVSFYLVKQQLPAQSYSQLTLATKTALTTNKLSLPNLTILAPLTSMEAQAKPPFLKKFPHLSEFKFLEAKVLAGKAKQWVKFPLMVVAIQEEVNVKTEIDSVNNAANRLNNIKLTNPNILAISRVQIGNLLDTLYTQGNNDADELTDLGANYQHGKTKFRVWAPTAHSVNVLIFDHNKQPITSPIPMTEDQNTGSWYASSTTLPKNVFYQYQVNLYHPATQQLETLITTDPYSLSLSTNSQYSQVVDLTDKSTYPAGWQSQLDTPVEQPTDNIFYELHIGDFSAWDTSISNSLQRGKYAAFSNATSRGIKHLKQLNEAGINTIHLLPTFDIGTINENPYNTAHKAITLQSRLSTICQQYRIVSFCQKSDVNHEKLATKSLLDYLIAQDPSNANAQAIVTELRAFDDYNWGYDPYHYSVPEGSYAETPDGISRLIEFRQMIMSLHNLGFRVVMDVVYNHTHQAGISGTAVLDKIVPQYYHRLDPFTGKIAQSTCCDNTATERKMMAKLMIDSLIVWATHYRIDGFRFDLMAHQPKSVMLAALKAVKAIDSDTYFYGEGWNFGEVANNQRFIQASQLELAGTGIGTFTDRLRDAVRGGAFTASGDGIRQSQGIGNGLADHPNELLANSDNTLNYLTKADQLRIGLAGNLATFSLRAANGEIKTGAQFRYGNQPSGYALTPSDTINYVSKHDNQTLWDNNQYRLPYQTSTEDRIRYQLLSLSFPLLAQGIPFIHMGSELLRSKSFLRDSYDFSHWFNKVDFSYQHNNYNVGLPPEEKDLQNWPLISKLLNNNEGRDHVESSDIIFSSDVFLELVKIRMGSPLFRLNSAHAIEQQLSFLNTGEKQQHGLIVMKLSNDPQRQNDTRYQEIIVLFNASQYAQIFAYQDASQYSLHPIQQKSVDQKIREAKATPNAFYVPAISTSVFVKMK